MRYQSEIEQHLSIHAVLFMDLISSYPLLCCYVFYVVNIDFFFSLTAYAFYIGFDYLSAPFTIHIDNALPVCPSITHN